jgi:macrodomain Ter protein organizer (MatP/YcbG family)
VPRTTRTLRTDLPNDVWDRLADEARDAGVPLARFVRNLIVARDAKKYGAKS